METPRLFDILCINGKTDGRWVYETLVYIPTFPYFPHKKHQDFTPTYTPGLPFTMSYTQAYLHTPLLLAFFLLEISFKSSDARYHLPADFPGSQVSAVRCSTRPASK